MIKTNIAIDLRAKFQESTYIRLEEEEKRKKKKKVQYNHHNTSIKFTLKVHITLNREFQVLV